MFSIRRIYDDVLPVDKLVVDQARAMLRDQFRLLSDEEIDELPALLRDPLKHLFRAVLFAAEKKRLEGFALLLHFPDFGFCYLDYLSVALGGTGRGIGGVLYERVRREARTLCPAGLFMECLPDDPLLCSDPKTLEQNKARLRFYERYGARPIVNTAYETPVNPGDDCPPYLVLDPLGRAPAVGGKKMRAIVQAILERKYGDVCSPEYVHMVARSFRDNPVRLREPRYRPAFKAEAPAGDALAEDLLIRLVVNDRHDIHHVHERGYVQAPVRISRIQSQLLPTGLFKPTDVKMHPEKHIKRVHDPDFVDYLKRICARIPPDKSLYPYVFPIRNAARPPRELPVRAGYYCIDTFTPLSANAYKAARRAVDCGLTAAGQILSGCRLAYALVRPPGHHAERRAFGGFCYFNTAAIAADSLSQYGRVAVLDIDYHHGNGTQDIFYQRPDVLTVSIHGHPGFAYPYFSGFKDETGLGEGEGFNLNLPLLEHVDGHTYRNVLGRAIKRIAAHRAAFLVLALGLDTAKADPTGTWSLLAKDFQANGRMIGEIGIPTLVVQEGGYRIRSIGTNARRFFEGLWAGHFSLRPPSASRQNHYPRPNQAQDPAGRNNR